MRADTNNKDTGTSWWKGQQKVSELSAQQNVLKCAENSI